METPDGENTVGSIETDVIYDILTTDSEGNSKYKGKMKTSI